MRTPAKPLTTALQVFRTQYRVGHGGFHTTIVKSDSGSFVYVYDTGATPQKSRVLAAIDDFIKNLKSLNITEIDYLILSHIDEDHVNGFKELVKELDREHIAHPTVMLPWLEPAEKLLALAHANHRGQGAAAVALAGDDRDVVSYLLDYGFTNILFVLPPGADGNVDPPSGSRFVTAGQDLALKSSPVPWKLIVTRIRPPQSTLNCFSNLIHAQTQLDVDKSADREELVRRHRSLIRRVMRSAATLTGLSGYGHSLTNWSSLSIYGASPGPTSVHLSPGAARTGDLTLSCDHGWLHTGDLPLNLPGVWSEFQHSWKQHLPQGEICALAAPHHGSPNGHNRLLFTTFSPKSVLYMTGWTAGSIKSGQPIYAKKINPGVSMSDARTAGASVIELNNPVARRQRAI